MTTLFTKIIDGEVPGHFVYKDDHAVAFMTIAPITEGHTLVIPRQEIDHWIDMPADTANHVMQSSLKVGQAIQKAFNPIKVGVMVAGLEVNHVHYHLVPIQKISDLNFDLQQTNIPAEKLAEAAAKIRVAMKELGYEDKLKGCE